MPQGLLHRVASGSLWYGGWPPPQRVIPGGKAKTTHCFGLVVFALWSNAPGGPVVKTLIYLPMQGLWVHSLAGELRSCISSVQLLSRVGFFTTPRNAACQASLSIISSWSLPKLMSIESVMPSNHLILYPPLLLLPSIFPSIRVFSNEPVLHIRRPKHWSFSFSTSPSNEYSGLISFRVNWLDLLAVQGTLKSLPQHHSSKASILLRSAFFISNSHIRT